MIVILTGNWQIHGSAVLAAASFLWLAGHEKFFISMRTPAVLQMCCFKHCSDFVKCSIASKSAQFA